MIRHAHDNTSPARKQTPAPREAAERFDEILRETAGMWDNEEGERIVKMIDDIFESPASKVPPPGLR